MTSPALDLTAAPWNWLQAAVTRDASDVHLLVGHRPACRIHGVLSPIDSAVVRAEDLVTLLDRTAPEGLLERLHLQKNVDFSFDVELSPRHQRFRANLFETAADTGLCLRLVPDAIPSLDWAGFPKDAARRLASLRDGLVIVAGITGSGKTTTLAMIVDQIIQQGGLRILTVEEPIEYQFPPSDGSLVSQREVGSSVLSFADGLRSGLRQDPDVILVGEIRDRETGQMALSAAETGHLVLTTLHSRDAKGTISRFADLFPQESQLEIRLQLAMNLQAVICQRLLPDVDPDQKRHLALEILWNCIPIAGAIRQGKLESIDNYLLTRRQDGLLGFDESIRQLWARGKISREVAERNVRDASILRG